MRLADIGLTIVSSRRPGDRSSLICVQHPRYSAESLYDQLNRAGIVTTPRLGRLRISPHFYNTRAEADCLIEVISKLGRA